MLELVPLEFEPPAQHSACCCVICNPQAFADYETACVAVRRPGGNRAHVCLSCVRLLAKAARGQAGTNARDLARWGRLELAAQVDREAWPKRRRR